MNYILPGATVITLGIATPILAQTTWTVTPNSGYTIQDQGVLSHVLTFALNGVPWTVTPSSTSAINDQGVANNVLTFTLSPAISPDGSTITAGSGGSLTTSAGVWTFSTTPASGGYQILLNGTPGGGGSALELEVSNGGNMYALNKLNIWYAWKGTSWAAIAPLNGTYVITSGSNAVDGGFGEYPGNSPFVQLYPTNNGSGQQWTWNGSTLQNMLVPVGGVPGAASGPFLADAGNGTASESATGDTFKLTPVTSGYNIQDIRTGNYFGIANGTLVLGTKSKSVWSFNVP
jgi:hypothetical protein